MCNRLEDLGEETMYNEEELKELEKWFGKKIDFAYPGWVCFSEGEGRNKYQGCFSKESEDLMISIAERRIKKVEDFATKIDACKTTEEALNLCIEPMIKFAQSWENKETHSVEYERYKKFFTSITSIKVEYGKRNLESNYPCYNAIVVRYGKNNFYAGSLVIGRYGDRWNISRRVPLAGQCDYKTDSLHLKKALIDFMYYVS